ncbi:hypothetical protein PCC6912_50900 [Chlorogloeopsis fritschii PCC 6912]|uniref:Uncharacterized protein n=2 Tax=Chlorogloeopsis fritschii TaxID=1124 RepID=A0A433N1M5_CHLFR|nr:hypothetical protein PCC6912_50900 [Chlorogloeopsis fritschii PCC 6912]
MTTKLLGSILDLQPEIKIKMKTELGYFQRQALIEKLVQRFAAINGYNIEPVQILDANHPQIKIWIAMAEAAVEEMENAINEK